MSDSTPSPAPAPDPKNPSKRGQVNQEWLAEFTNSEAIVAAATPADRAAKLAAGGIDAAKIAALTAAILAARKLAGRAVQGTSGKHIITDNEDTLKTALLEKIQYVQKRARQKYDAMEPGRLADYAIGGPPITNSRSTMEQAGANILLKLQGNPQAKPPVPPDVLPGVDAARITALAAALDDYIDVKGDQSGAQSDATQARKLAEAAVADIVTKRREIQFAADADWPHTDPANAGIRVEFQLPPDRVMK